MSIYLGLRVYERIYVRLLPKILLEFDDHDTCISPYLCVCVCICVCVFVCICVFVCVRVSTTRDPVHWRYRYDNDDLSIYFDFCLCVRTCVCLCVCVCMCLRVGATRDPPWAGSWETDTHTKTHKHTHTRTHIHTYTQTHTNKKRRPYHRRHTQGGFDHDDTGISFDLCLCACVWKCSRVE